MEEQPKNEQREIEDEMKQSYLDYSMSVIVGRALPDVRDGLKPVHRRILYAMNEMGMFHNKPYKKCARIVGDTLGRYHPHGDTAVYDALVRMVQDFSLRYPLIQGQGNFGSVDGDNAAAMRYTEARLKNIAEEMLADIDKNTVDFTPNFDNSLKEPTVLPAKIPNLLVNGSTGIAVGMATNVPPHNLTEVGNAVVHLIDNPDSTCADLMGYVKGPDFPTYGTIYGKAGIRQAYEHGRGKVIVRAKAEIEEVKNHERIIITEIPYMVNKSQLLEQIADLVKLKRVNGVSDLRDESDREGMRIVIELQSGAHTTVVLNQLYKHTRLQTTFGMNMLALVDNQPRVLNLKQLITYFVKHRQDVVRRRTEFELDKAEARCHILEGLIIALDNIDAVIQKIKKSADIKSATAMLVAEYKLTEKQAKAILEMRLQKLSSLEQDKIRDEHKELTKLIAKLKEILADENRILSIIKDETKEIVNKYGDERRTEIIEKGLDLEIDIEDLVTPEEVVVTMTHRGYTKRLPVDTYRKQRRGGKGVIAQANSDEDFVEDIFVANTLDYILFFTNIGKVHWLKVYEIPESSRTARGTAIRNLLNLKNDERITAYVKVNEFKGFLFMGTKKGVVKKTTLEQFSHPRKGGIIALGLDADDELIGVRLTDGQQQMILATRNGQAARFRESDVRPMGRTARGVRGIRLRMSDEVVSLVVADDKVALLTLSEKGFGKRTPVADYRLIGRGGSGVINMKCTDRNGRIVSVHSVNENDEMMLISEKGIGIRTAVKDISVIGRNTQGVRVMRLSQEDKLVAAAKIARENGSDKLDSTIESVTEK